MALTVLQELEILKHAVGPAFLEDLIHQVAMGEGVTFYSGYKIFDGGANPEAQAYLDKMLGIIARVNQVDSATIKSLQKITVSLIGDSAHDWATVQAATDEDWEIFIVSNMIRAFELLGRVLQSEKTAYNDLA